MKELKDKVNSIPEGYDNCWVARADEWSDESGYEFMEDLVDVVIDCWDTQGGAFFHLKF